MEYDVVFMSYGVDFPIPSKWEVRNRKLRNKSTILCGANMNYASAMLRAGRANAAMDRLRADLLPK